MWLLGVMTYLFPRLLKKEWYSRTMCEWHFWMSAGGLAVMALDLTLAGLFQGWSWMGLEPWEHSIEVSQPFWVTRIFAGMAMALAQVIFLCNLYMTWAKSPAKVEEPTGAPATA